MLEAQLDRFRLAPNRSFFAFDTEGLLDGSRSFFLLSPLSSDMFLAGGGKFKDLSEVES